MIFLKSPHVNKKSKEHFSFSKYKLLCIFYDNNNNYKNIFYYKPTTLKIKILKEK